MRLASLQGGRDGRLALVTDDLQHCALVPDIAATLQQALDHWDELIGALQERDLRLQAGDLDGLISFDTLACAAPLPRAYQWADGSAYVNHVELVRRARGATMPDSFWQEPLMYQGGSDSFLGPRDDVVVSCEAWGIDFEAEVAVITGDVPMGIDAEAALQCIRLVTLVNDVSLRELIPGELAKGFGFMQSKPACSFAPLAVTPDTLGDAWRGGRVHLPLLSHYNGALFGCPDAGVDMTFDFGRLVAHAARTRTLTAGSIVGSGTVSNRQEAAAGDVGDAGEGAGKGTGIRLGGGVGYSCLAELRMVETLRHGAPRTPFMRWGDRIRIEMLDGHGRSIFGAIDQQVIADHPGELQ